FRRLLEPSGQVERIPGRHGGAAKGVADHDLSRLHTEADAESDPVARARVLGECLGPFLDGDRGADRPLGIVLVSLLEAEDTEHGVAAELLDGAAVKVDLPGRHLEEASDQAAHHLRVDALAQAGRPDQVCEQGGDVPALLHPDPGEGLVIWPLPMAMAVRLSILSRTASSVGTSPAGASSPTELRAALSRSCMRTASSWVRRVERSISFWRKVRALCSTAARAASEALDAFTRISFNWPALASTEARRPAIASAAPAKWVAFFSSPSLRALCSIRIACSIDAFKRSISSSVRASRMSSSRSLPTTAAACCVNSAC